MKQNEFQARIDRSLSGLNWDAGKRQRVLLSLDREEKKKKKISWILALTLVLLLAFMAAGLATGGFGVLQFREGQKDNDAYTRLITEIGRQYENDFFTLRLNETAFDGVRLSCTMELEEKNAGPVYVIPRVIATAGGEELHLLEDTGAFFDGEPGFWVPNIRPMHERNNFCGIDFTLSYDPEEGYDPLSLWHPVGEAVTWDFSFTVLRPNWPLLFTQEDEPGMDEEPWTEEEYQQYDQQFMDAYERQTILLDRYANPVWYMACIPQRDGVDGGEKTWEELCENLLQYDIFTVADEFAFRFETSPQPVRTAKKLPVFTLPDGYRVEVRSLSVTVDSLDMELKITREGKDAAEDCGALPWSFAVLSGDAATSVQGASVGKREDGSWRYECRVELFGTADQIQLIPCRSSKEGADAWEVFKQQRTLTQEQRDLAVTIVLE